MLNDPADRLQKTLILGHFKGVNPPITDSATYAFDSGPAMTDCFEGKSENAFLYSRHWNPTNLALSTALAAMENTGSAWVTSSGMAAITSALLQICNSGDHIVSSMTTYGGTYAFLKNYLPKFNIDASFVDITDLDAVRAAIKPTTKIIYTESITNPLLQVSDIPSLAEIANQNGLKLLVDNTFTPMIINPFELGAQLTLYSMTKFINGKNDCVAGAICGSEEFINELIDVTTGTCMLLGPVLDPIRAAGIHKNLFTLHIRMKQHSHNAAFLAKKMFEYGLDVTYPGLSNHPQHELMKKIMNPEYGFGGLLTIDMGTEEKASELMVKMQNSGVGYIAVSLGYFKTLFSNSSTSTSSEVPGELQDKMGLTKGLIRFSIGLDQDIEATWNTIQSNLREIS